MPRAEAEPYAIALGEAFQLTNFLRDVGEDVDRGRVYLPADLMAAHGVTREQVAEKRHDARFAALMREMVAVVRRRYDDAAPGTPCSRRSPATASGRPPRSTAGSSGRSSGPTTGCSTAGCRCRGRAAWRCSPAG